MINSILVEDNFDVLTSAFENLKSFSTSMINFSVAAFAFIALIDLNFITFFADHASFLTSRFQSLQNCTIVNVRREHDQIKKEIQILQVDSSSFLDKETSEESIKKDDRMIRTMIYYTFERLSTKK